MLSGRVALVTGGSGGIGAALCRALAAEGAIVAVGYRDRSELAGSIVQEIEDAGGRAASFPADLLVPRASELLVDAVESALGPVDVLVSNHGHAHRASFDEVDVGAWDETLAINLRAPFLLAQRVIPGMKDRGFGRILFVSSVAGFTGGIVGPHYAASKAGLHGLTHFLASRVAEAGITVNALAPALIEHTDMLPGDPGYLQRTIPVGRLGQPSEVADMAIAMLRNAYLTSKVIALDGGMHPR
ncbi:SDR family NAD(P)-dependent oxidoreductase [Baekduia sp. Peel2402]|uniref:SDR family NAD(P)-dependent oxidoreductase n=1 Tax=Baekduia sp. Peel2402 TaxID=3458296 RepID=UPI00403E38AC